MENNVSEDIELPCKFDDSVSFGTVFIDDFEKLGKVVKEGEVEPRFIPYDKDLRGELVSQIEDGYITKEDVRPEGTEKILAFLRQNTRKRWLKEFGFEWDLDAHLPKGVKDGTKIVLIYRKGLIDLKVFGRFDMYRDYGDIGDLTLERIKEIRRPWSYRMQPYLLYFVIPVSICILALEMSEVESRFWPIMTVSVLGGLVRKYKYVIENRFAMQKSYENAVHKRQMRRANYIHWVGLAVLSAAISSLVGKYVF